MIVAVNIGKNFWRPHVFELALFVQRIIKFIKLDKVFGPHQIASCGHVVPIANLGNRLCTAVPQLWIVLHDIPVGQIVGVAERRQILVGMIGR